MKNLLFIISIFFLVIHYNHAQEVRIIENVNETLIIIDANVTGGILFNANDAGGGLAAYPSTFPIPFQHFADRVSLFSNSITATGLDLRADGDTSDIRFYTGGLLPVHERMRITKDGKVGIGKDIPDHQLHVEGTVYGIGAPGIHGNSPFGGSGVYGFGWNGIQGEGATGVYGSGTNYGVYYSGGLAGTGTKSAIVKTLDGPKTVYCQESPENWFEDFGSGIINEGSAQVSVAADFMQTVTINDDYPMKVFVTPNANLGNWWVEKRKDDFILHAPGAADGATFDYRIVAKRKGFETLRLETSENAFTDRYLYPTIDEVPDAYKDAWLKVNVKEFSRVKSQHTKGS